MNEGILCKKEPVNTKEELDTLLKDGRGKQYYEEMTRLEVDTAALRKSLDDSRMCEANECRNMCG